MHLHLILFYFGGGGDYQYLESVLDRYQPYYFMVSILSQGFDTSHRYLRHKKTPKKTNNNKKSKSLSGVVGHILRQFDTLVNHHLRQSKRSLLTNIWSMRGIGTLHLWVFKEWFFLFTAPICNYKPLYRVGGEKYLQMLTIGIVSLMA